MHAAFRIGIGLLGVAMALAGCRSQTQPPDSGPSAAAHVTGIVTLQGAPVAGAIVRASTGGTAVTDAAGHYCVWARPFEEVTISASYVPPADVHAGSWWGSATVRTGDFSGCEHALEQNIALEYAPI